MKSPTRGNHGSGCWRHSAGWSHYGPLSPIAIAFRCAFRAGWRRLEHPSAAIRACRRRSFRRFRSCRMIRWRPKIRPQSRQIRLRYRPTPRLHHRLPYHPLLHRHPRLQHPLLRRLHRQRPALLQLRLIRQPRPLQPLPQRSCSASPNSFVCLGVGPITNAVRCSYSPTRAFDEGPSSN